MRHLFFVIDGMFDLERRGVRKRVVVPGLGRIGWVDEDDIESAGEMCPAVYLLN